MKKCVFLLLGLSLLSGCTVHVWGKREVVEIESTPRTPSDEGTMRASALPPAAIPLIESIFSGLFKFWGKSREMKEKTHMKGIEFNRPVKRDEESYLLKVTE